MYRSQIIIRANSSAIGFILQAVYLDIIPHSLDDTNATLLFDAQDVS